MLWLLIAANVDLLNMEIWKFKFDAKNAMFVLLTIQLDDGL